MEVKSARWQYSNAICQPCVALWLQLAGPLFYTTK